MGKGKRARNVVSGNNHHMAIYAELDENGNEKKWVGEVVTLLEAKERLKNGEPIVNRDPGHGRKFVMSVKCGDVFEMDFCRVLNDGEMVPCVHLDLGVGLQAHHANVVVLDAN